MILACFTSHFLVQVIHSDQLHFSHILVSVDLGQLHCTVSVLCLGPGDPGQLHCSVSVLYLGSVDPGQLHCKVSVLYLGPGDPGQLHCTVSVLYLGPGDPGQPHYSHLGSDDLGQLMAQCT